MIKVNQKVISLRLEFQETHEYIDYLVHKENEEISKKILGWHPSDLRAEIKATQILKKILPQKEQEIKVFYEKILQEQIQQVKEDLETDIIDRNDFRDEISSKLIQSLRVDLQRSNLKVKQLREELNKWQENEADMLTHHELSILWSSISRQKYFVKHDGGLSFNVNTSKGNILLKIARYFRLPKFNYLHLNLVPSESRDLKTFLLKSVYHPLEVLTFSKSECNLTRISPYLESLLWVIPKVTRNLQISGWKLSSAEFYEILIAAKHTELIEFSKCAIATDEQCNLKDELPDANFKQINFIHCGSANLSNWKKHPERFANIFKSLGKVPSVRLGLQTVGIKETELKIYKARQLILLHGLEKTKVEDVC